MAITKITPVKMADVNEISAAVAFTAATAAADGFSIPMQEQDAKTVLLFQNTDTAAAHSAVVKKGNGIQGVVDLATGDIAASAIVALTVDSGAFKNVTGENKGCAVVVPDDVKLKAAVVVLP